jgi:hypothetical protein
MRAASDRLFWSLATAATLAGVAMMTSETGAAAPPLAPAAACPMPPLGSTWSTRTLGSTDYDTAAGIAVDEARCAIYVAGDTLGVIGAASAGHSDGVLAKYSTTGTRAWVVQFGSSSFDYVDGVDVDAAGDIYVLGHTGGTLPGSPIINLGGGDLFLLKFDASGVLLWTRQLGTPGDENPTDLAVLSTGDVYVTGFTDGTLIGASAGGQDYFLGRYDPNGNLVMLMQRGSAGNDRAIAVAVGPSDGAYIVGNTDGDLQGVQAGNGDIFVAKYNTAGAELWIDQRGTADLEISGDIAVNSQNDVFVAVSTGGGLDGNVSQGAMDMALLRYDANGTWRFTTQRGSTSTDLADGIGLSASGAPYVIGTTSGTLDGLVPAGYSDVFLMKLGRGGAWSWTRLIGGTSDDFAARVAVSSADNVFISGDFAIGLNGVVSAGSRDVFAVSYTSAGALR